MRRGPAQEASTAILFPSGEKDGLKALFRNFSFGAGGEIFSPNIAAIILAENVTRLQLAARLIGANK